MGPTWKWWELLGAGLCFSGLVVSARMAVTVIAPSRAGIQPGSGNGQVCTYTSALRCAGGLRESHSLETGGRREENLLCGGQFGVQESCLKAVL